MSSLGFRAFLAFSSKCSALIGNFRRPEELAERVAVDQSEISIFIVGCNFLHPEAVFLPVSSGV